ncbi:hypothetical protein [Cryobacterium sp.]|uniref:hypothetical protein n=1 Tax=Cryobacterium sp. TaxID=1926290 RepID=UPI002617D729|nr:hypothetical protein [Cryobacterium sp.]
MTPSLHAATRTSRRPAPVADLEALRVRNEDVVTAVSAAPVQHLPAELLDALLGSWGTPEELGLAPQRRLHVVAG